MVIAYAFSPEHLESCDHFFYFMCFWPENLAASLGPIWESWICDNSIIGEGGTQTLDIFVRNAKKCQAVATRFLAISWTCGGGMMLSS